MRSGRTSSWIRFQWTLESPSPGATQLSVCGICVMLVSVSFLDKKGGPVRPHVAWRLGPHAALSPGFFPVLMGVVSRRPFTASNAWPCCPPCQDFLPADIQTQLAVSRELIRNICNSFHRLRDRAERIASRAVDNAADLLVFGKELRQVPRRGGVCRLGGRRRFTTATPVLTSFTVRGRRRGLGKWVMEFRRRQLGEFRQGRVDP